MRTIEQRLIFDSGLTVGKCHLVRLTMGDRARDALVEVKRKKVYILIKPDAGAMYSCWYRLDGNELGSMRGGVIVWGARDPEFMRAFAGDPVATLEVHKPS